jgi:predicted ATPase
LAHLQAAEFLYETSLFPDLEYTFKHSLTHEVTYGSVLQDRRRQLHAALVVIMERHYAGRLVEHAERLAYHAVRGEVWEKAVTHLWQAGRSARLRSAFRPAVAFLEQAVDALKRLPETAERAAVGIDLRCIDLSDPLSTLGRHDRILEHMREAARLAEKVGDRPRLTEVLARTVAPLRRLGRYAQAVAIGERALALSQELADARLNRHGARLGSRARWQPPPGRSFVRSGVGRAGLTGDRSGRNRRGVDPALDVGGTGGGAHLRRSVWRGGEAR